MSQFHEEVPSVKCRFLPVLVLFAIAADRVHRWQHSSESAKDHDSGASPKSWIYAAAELATALTLFFFSGPALIVLNKHIYTQLEFSFPIAVSSLGSLVLVIVVRGGVGLGICSLSKPVLPWRLFLTNVFPLSVCTSFSIVVGNIVYLYISLPLIQILKSGTLVLVMIFGFLMGVERFRWGLVIAVMIMAAGISLALQSSYEPDASAADSTAFLKGIAIMMTGNALEAMRSVMLQVSVQKLEFVDSLYWSCPTMALVGFAMSVPLEMQQILQAKFSPKLVFALLGSGALGACVSFSAFWITKLLGGLSMKVLVNARNIGLVLYSVVILGEKCTDMEYIGYSVALVGIAMYDRVRATPTSASSVAVASTPGKPKVHRDTLAAIHPSSPASMRPSTSAPIRPLLNVVEDVVEGVDIEKQAKQV